MAGRKGSAGVALVETAEETPAATEQQPSVLETNAGKHEEEMTAATERMIEIGESFNFDFDTIVSDLRDHMMDVFKHRPKPWSNMVSSEQRDVAGGIEQVVRQCMAQIVNALAAEGRPNIRAKLESFTNKGGDIKATLKFMGNPTDEQVLSLSHATGKMVVLVTADVDDHDQPGHEAQIADDQGDIFEGGDVIHPADDSDLSGEDDDVATEFLEPAATDED